ncbi:hypothetical protein VPH35_103658 [Triticum aestivum]
MVAVCPSPSDACKSQPSRTTSCEVRPPAARCGMRVPEVEVEGWSGDDGQRKSRPRGRACPCGRRSNKASVSGFEEAHIAGSGSMDSHRSMASTLKRTATARLGWLPDGAARACAINVNYGSMDRQEFVGYGAYSFGETCAALILLS